MNISLDQAQNAYGAFHMVLETVPEGVRAHVPTHPHIPAVVKATEAEAINAMSERMNVFLQSNFQKLDG